MNRKMAWCIGAAVLLAAGLGGTFPTVAQAQLDRLESGIRAANSPTMTMVAAGQRAYLGARADDDIGGVRVLSVSSGGPADRAGLHARDLVVGAAGRKIRTLNELSAVLNGLKPGDRMSLEFLRGTQPLRTEVVVGAAPAAAQLGPPVAPPLPGPGAGRTESIPPPPAEPSLPSPPEGPAFAPTLPPVPPTLPPVPSNSPQAQIDELRRRVDQLEHRVQELERALTESRRK